VRGAVSSGETLLYKPVLYASAKLHYTDRKSGLDHWQTVQLVTPLDGNVEADPWASAEPRDAELAVAQSPEARASFAALPPAAARAKSFATWQKQLAAHLYRDCALVLWRCEEAESGSSPGESESSFRARVAHALREKRDLDMEKQRQKYAPKIERLRERIRAAQERVSREQSQATQSQLQTAVSIGATLVGALLGRKTFSSATMGRAATAARGVARASRDREDVTRAEDKVEDLQRELSELENEFSTDAGGVGKSVDPSTLKLEEMRVAPRKADVQVEQVVLLWMPWIASPSGNLTPAC
jgi:phage host-nuclease inhibitor protein Gam